MQPPPFTPISTLGEFGLIDHLTGLLGDSKADSVRFGIGDDAAVVDGDDGKAALLTTDMLVEGVHFDVAMTTMEQLGFKSIAVNISDICAMGGLPDFLLVALGVPNTVSVEMLSDLYRGMKSACDSMGGTIIGGDTSASPVLTVSATAFGSASNGSVVYRSGARPGDVICLTGEVGSAAAGLHWLIHEKNRLSSEGALYKARVSEFSHVVQRQLRPRARTDIVTVLSSDPRPGVTAMIDVSDGVASEVHHICRASGCGAEVKIGKLPIHPEAALVATELGKKASDWALFGGEDYELLFTISPDDLNRLTASGGTDFQPIPIGTITDESTIIFESEDGVRQELPSAGYLHF